jgi:iron complex outermembrane recepter protein
VPCRACAFLTALTLALSLALPARLAAQPGRTPLKGLSLDELMNLDITTASRRPEPISEAAAGVDVLTGEELRRSGITTLPEALRLAAGLFVARSDGRTWAIGTTRGFTLTAGNKLLVLIDGRTVFSPLFAGVFWEVHDVVLDDVDRIEVIRGPGATLWGPNAVNGVINVITKPASATMDWRVNVGAGDEERLFGTARFGDALGRNGHYRVYAKYVYLDANRTNAGESARDPLRRGQLGGRADWALSPGSDLTLQGDAYAGAAGMFDRPDTDIRGGNVIGRWRRRFSPLAELQVQTYYDYAFISIPVLFEESRGTWDIDVQYRRSVGARHSLLAGAGYRLARDTTGVPIEPGGPQALGIRAFFDPASRSTSLVSAFLQDDVTLAPERLFLTVGARVEHNAFTGAELQPTARLRWKPDARSTVWGAISRAVRTPTRLDSDVRYVRPDDTLFLRGSPDFRSEELIAVEAGYRIRPVAALSFDATVYRHSYDRLRSQEPAPEPGAIVLQNELRGTTAGLELEANWRPAEWTRWQAHWTLLDKQLRLRPGSLDPTGGRAEGNDPRQTFGLRGSVDLGRGLELDGYLRAIARLPQPVVPGYAELDLRAGWWLTPDLEVSVVGRNLLHSSHPEWGAPLPRRVEFERSVYARLSVLF